MKLVLRSVAGVLAGLLLLTGCAGRDPKVAAVVGDVTITVAQVEQTAAGLAEFNEAPERAGEIQASVLSQLIGFEAVRQIGQSNNITISEADKQALLATSTDLTSASADPRLTDFIDGTLQAYLVAQTLGQEATAQAVAGLTVEVNPRFGTWQPELIELDTTGGSLSTPATA